MKNRLREDVYINYGYRSFPDPTSFCPQLQRRTMQRHYEGQNPAEQPRLQRVSRLLRGMKQQSGNIQKTIHRYQRQF